MLIEGQREFFSFQPLHRSRTNPVTSTQPPGAAIAGDLRPDQTESTHQPPDASNRRFSGSVPVYVWRESTEFPAWESHPNPPR